MSEAGLGLVGDCNKCGLCCQGTLSDGVPWRCGFLEVKGIIGQPEATRCLLYKRRYDGMPIFLDAADGRRIEGKCTRNSPTETAIIVRHIGHGCSLRVAQAPIGVFVPTAAVAQKEAGHGA